MKTRHVIAAAVCAALACAGLGAPTRGEIAQASPAFIGAPVAKTAGPYSNPLAPGVDETTILAIPRAGTPAESMKTALREASPDGQQTTFSIRQAGKSRQVAKIKADRSSGPVIAEELADSGLFEAVDFDRELTLHYSAVPNDPHYSLRLSRDSGNHTFYAQWGLYDGFGSSFRQVWPQMGGFAGGWDSAPVAVIDSGCAFGHEDKGANMVAGYDFGQMDGDVSPVQSWLLDAWHGSGVASVIATATDNAKGMAGAAWDNKIICYKAADSQNKLKTLAVVQSILDAPTKGAKVINLSLGAAEPNAVEQWAVTQVIGQGVVVVASAGNDGEPDPDNPSAPWNQPNYPAGYPGVISVGASNLEGVRASFSNNNPQTHVDLLAPGVDIEGWAPSRILDPDEQWYCLSDGNYCLWDGTSFSGPLVAATAALILRARPGLTPDAVASILTSTAKSVSGQTGYTSSAGWGRLDANAAIAKALTSTTPAYFNPGNDGQFVAEVGKAFTFVLGVSGNPMPSAVVTAGSSLPPGVALSNLPGRGWSLSGTMTSPGVYRTSITAVGDGGTRIVRAITIHAAGFGNARIATRFVKNTISSSETAILEMTTAIVDPGTQPSGWFEIKDETTNVIVGSGVWRLGKTTLPVTGLAVGTHRFATIVHGANIGGPWQVVDTNWPRTLTVTRQTGGGGPQASPGVSVADNTLTPGQRGQVTFDPATFAPGASGTIEVIDVTTGRVVGGGTFANGLKTKITTNALSVGKHVIRLKITLVNGTSFTLNGGTITVAKIKPSITYKLKGSKLTITIKAKGVKRVKGKVVVKAGKKKAKTLKLKKGKATLKLKKGKAKVKATFKGTKTIAKRTVKKTLTVR